MKFKITEEKANRILKEIYESISPSAEMVGIVKEYLDKNFARQEIDDISPDGYPVKSKVVSMLSSDGQPVKTMTPQELLMLLDDKFHKSIADDNDRKAFLKQVITDWYGRNIGRGGVLSTNIIR